MTPQVDLWTHWRSADYSPGQQFDSWCAALNDSFLPWELRRPSASKFDAEIDMKELGGVRMLHCITDPCQGLRSKQIINRGSEAYFGLLFVYDGHECVSTNNHEQFLDNQHGVLWDSTRPIEFSVAEKLKKVTILVPQEKLRTRLPNVDQFVNEKISLSSGIGAVTASYMVSLSREAASIESGTGDSIVDLSLELIATCLEAKLPRQMTKARYDLLSGIKTFIERNLDDPELSPSTVAARFNISNRYLHMLFEDDITTAANYILHKRLEKCRQELMSSGSYKRNITEIAFDWGFNDSAHFCRVFKSQFGLTPREYQKKHLL